MCRFVLLIAACVTVLVLRCAGFPRSQLVELGRWLGLGERSQLRQAISEGSGVIVLILSSVQHLHHTDTTMLFPRYGMLRIYLGSYEAPDAALAITSAHIAI